MQWLLFLGLGCSVYFMKIAYNLSNPDSIWNGTFYKASGAWEVSLGRYMIVVLQILRANVVNTSFFTIVSIVLLSLICILLIKIFQIKTLGWKLVAGTLIIVSPTVGSTLTYYYCSDLYMLSYLLAVLAVWFMVRRSGKSGILPAGVCLMLSAAIYQAYICLAVLLCLIYMIKLLLDDKIPLQEIREKVCNCLLGGIFGVGLYLVSNKVVQTLLKIEAESSRGFSKMGLIRLNDLPRQVGNCYRLFFQYYFSDSMINNRYGFRNCINLVYFVILIVLILSILLKHGMTVGRKIAFGILCILFPLISMSICVFAPEVSILASTGVLMLPAMNYVYIMAVVLLPNSNTNNRWTAVSRAAVFVGACFVLSMLLHLELDGQSYMKHNMLKTYHVASQISEKLAQYDDFDKICIIGNMEGGNYPELYPKLAQSQHWVSAGYKTIWTTYDGCQSCWVNFIKQYLGVEYIACSIDDYRAIKETAEYSAMKTFPESGGVAIINNIAVIKLSDAAW